MNWTQGKTPSNHQSQFIEANNQSQSQRQIPPHKRDGEIRTSSSPKENYNHRQISQVQNRHDTAATFTRDGLQAFAQIFSSTVESAITNALPKIIERALEDHLQGLMQKTMDGVTESVSNQIAQATTDIQTSVQQQLMMFLQATDITRAPKVEHQQKITTVSRIDVEVESVIQALETAGGTMTAQGLRAATDVNWGKNGTVKMNSIMRKANGRIQRIGKGLYQVN